MSATGSSGDSKNVDQVHWFFGCVVWLGIFLGIFYICRSMRGTETYKVPEFSISGAQLNRFNYTETNHTLSYNLTLNITLTNPQPYSCDFDG
ncbi:hypothetical protein GBA52_003314 [Prunus armeniaca]|nr:hypothetical protein GBA52_003314 [Prunus armeniaca]